MAPSSFLLFCLNNKPTATTKDATMAMFKTTQSMTMGRKILCKDMGIKN